VPPFEFAVGVGLRPGNSADRILAAIREALGDNPICCLATVDRRADEPGLRAAATHLAVPVHAYTAADLARVPVPNPSSRTRSALGTASVAEAAAMLAAHGPLAIPKRTIDGIVIAAALCTPTPNSPRPQLDLLRVVGPAGIRLAHNLIRPGRRAWAIQRQLRCERHRRGFIA
jgi:cobalt-precorrin 5A hydrolase